MAAPTTARSPRRPRPARPLRTFVAAAGAVVALLAAVVLPNDAGATRGTAARQLAPAVGEPSLTVFGVGEAAAPAEVAAVQLLLGPDPAGFGFSEFETTDGSGGSSSTGVVAVDSVATPTAGLTDDGLAPVLAALEATGVDRDGVRTILSPLAVDPYGGRSGSARLDFEVAQPSLAGMGELVTAVSDAAADAGLVVQVVGVRYDIADCAALAEEAQRAAIADAREQAERLARLLEVTIGDVVAAGTLDAFGRTEGACGVGPSGSYYDSGFGGLGVSLAPFDPAATPEVRYRTELSVSYVIVGEDA